jgi:hypothetical protein
MAYGGVQFAHRVVGDCRKVHHTLVALEVVDGDVADVLAQIPVCGSDPFPGAVLEQAQIASGDTVAGLLQQVHKVGADIAFMACDKDFHARSRPVTGRSGEVGEMRGRRSFGVPGRMTGCSAGIAVAVVDLSGNGLAGASDPRFPDQRGPDRHR